MDIRFSGISEQAARESLRCVACCSLKPSEESGACISAAGTGCAALPQTSFRRLTAL
ncbi:protein of unknown function [Pararobbsia alpina]